MKRVETSSRKVQGCGLRRYRLPKRYAFGAKKKGEQGCRKKVGLLREVSGCFGGGRAAKTHTKKQENINTKKKLTKEKDTECQNSQ